MIDFSTPLSGMTQAETTVNKIATRIASPTNDQLQLSDEMVSLAQARDNFSLDVKIAQAEDQMTTSALNIIA